MNVKLLQKVKHHILEEPRRLQMGRWIDDGPPCGTAACIAGWVCLLSGMDKLNLIRNVHEIPEIARKLLDITSVELFFSARWHGGYDEAFMRAINHTERAKIAADHIDYFCEKYHV